ncbi:MAG: arginine--tRNA ligase [bacterium]
MKKPSDQNKKDDDKKRAVIAEVFEIDKQVIDIIFDAIKKVYGKEINLENIKMENPPRPELGDIAVACHLFAKQLKQNPNDIAEKLAGAIKLSGVIKTAKNKGPYINFSLAKDKIIEKVCSRIIKEDKNYGKSDIGKGKQIMIEYSGPNSNKALHLGHLRNNQIGISLVNVFRMAGYEVVPVNIINDRGIHICKSMVAYLKWGKEETPESAKIKGDHFVGNLYARFIEARDNEFAEWLLKEKDITLKSFNSIENEQEKNKITKEFESESYLVQESHEVLRKWEDNDPEIRQLWQKMNDWVYKGFEQTYKRQGVKFDKVYLESETYKLGKKIVLEYLEKGILKRNNNGDIVIDLTSKGLDEKVLIRADGTSVYITQDIGTVVMRFEDYKKLDKLIYVVASEQDYHFNVLFKTLKTLGYSWADKCFHMSHGMVNLPSGKISSRKLKQGGVFLADDLMDNLHNLAEKAVLKRGPDLSKKEVNNRAEIISQAALKYFLLKVNPNKNMIFEPEKSLDFEGNTGPYLQYAYARICSILRKAKNVDKKSDLSLLNNSEEFELVKILAEFPKIIEKAVKGYDSAIIASYLYEIAKSFSFFYNKHRILGSSSELEKARLVLVQATAIVLKNGLSLLGIEILDKM